MDEMLLKIPQVCDLTQLGRSTIYQLLDRPGGLATVRIGRAVRVHIDEVRSWVERQQAAGHGKI
jgi:excisionase family DNA binding protein